MDVHGFDVLIHVCVHACVSACKCVDVYVRICEMISAFSILELVNILRHSRMWTVFCYNQGRGVLSCLSRFTFLGYVCI